MKSIDRLIEIIKRLRAPDGCPWDREQTHKSIRGHLVEECAELLEAIDNEDNTEMREELGDVFMHLLLHSEIASEQNAFTFDDVATDLGDKLIRRHPHVFGDATAKNSADVLNIWQAVKKEEKKARVIGGLFDGIPPQLSAMRLALDIAKKADAQTLDTAKSVSQKRESELSQEPKKAAAEKFGRQMFELILEASKNKVEPESALRDYLTTIRNSCKD